MIEGTSTLGSGFGGVKKTIKSVGSILSLILVKYFKLKIFKVSIDDFYKTRNERKKLSQKKHPLLMTRGVPGTHDTHLIKKFFDIIKTINFTIINKMANSTFCHVRFASS